MIAGYNPDDVVGRSKADLERVVRDLDEVSKLVHGVGYYFDAEYVKTLVHSNWLVEIPKGDLPVFLDALTRANN